MKRRVFAIFLIVIGISIIVSAFLMKNSSKKVQHKMLEDFQSTIQESANDKDKSPNNKPVKEENINAMGIMIIPKIDLKVAIAEGVDNEILKYAVGHFEGTAMPGEKGNFCVAGHRSYTYNEYFNRLDEVKIGDEIIVKTHKNEFKYKVDDIKIVEPKEVSVLDNTKKSTITLVTCTPIRVATHRLIIKGTLEEK